MSRSAVHAASVQCLFSNSSSGNLTTVSVNLPDDNINGIGVCKSDDQSEHIVWILLMHGCQVMIAFLLGAYLPWVVAAAFYVTGLIPPRYVNNYDTLFLKIKPRPSSDLVQSLRKGFFSFSIQQLVLSISLLSAAFAKIAEMIQFDFHTVIYMAWMTFTAHLATLFLLQDYFISSPVYRAVELFSMLVLMILLCVALYPTTNWSWSTSVLTQALCPDPAHCSALINKVPLFLQRARESNGSGGLSPQGVLSYFVIIASYIWQATSLLNSEGHVLKKVMRKPIFWVERAISHIASNEANGKRATFTKFRRSTLVGLYCFLLALLDLLGSFAFHLFIVFVAQGWGLIQLLIPRFHVLPACIREALSQWDFGQIFPMIILLTPLYGVVENISSKYNSRQDINQLICLW